VPVSHHCEKYNVYNDSNVRALEREGYVIKWAGPEEYTNEWEKNVKLGTLSQG